MALGTNGSTLHAELNRLANGGTYPAIQSYVGAAKAANTWAGTTEIGRASCRERVFNWV